MCHEYCPSPMCHEYSSFRCDILLLHHFVSFRLYFLLANTKDFSPSVDSDVQHLRTGLAYPALWCWACQFRTDINDLWTPQLKRVLLGLISYFTWSRKIKIKGGREVRIPGFGQRIKLQ